VNVRDAIPADAAMIAAIWAPQVLETAVTFNSVAKTPQDVAQMIAQRPCFMVAEQDGAICGFVSTTSFAVELVMRIRWNTRLSLRLRQKGRARVGR